MDDGQRKNPEKRGVTLLPVKGSLIGGIPKLKTARITEAMTDLQLAMDGLRSQPPGDDGDRWVRTLGAFARTCSVFLRKTVLGDFGRRESRLLDDHVLNSTGLTFDPLRTIPREGRRWVEVGHGLLGAELEVTKLNEETLEADETYRFWAGPQAVELSIEWPLPGAADWTGVPTEESLWPVGPDQLFETGGGRCLSCDEWLGQQVVLFDGKGISLKEMIRTVVNFEGAHSIDDARLATVAGEQPSKAAKNPGPHILNAVTLFGIRYANLIVIECAVYLYEKLLKETSIERPRGDLYKVKPGVKCRREQAESSRPDWIKFQGGMMISFYNPPKVTRHKIKAVK